MRRAKGKWAQVGAAFNGVWLILLLGAFPAFAFWQKIDEGFEFRTLRLEGPPYESAFQLHILRIDPRKFSVRVMDSRAFGSERMTIKALAQKARALAAVNGGFFTPEWKPLGLLIADGFELNPLRKTDWGIFMVRNGQPRIIHTNEFRFEKDISQAVQVGPRLVVEGREVRLKRQSARRSAIGITVNRQIILLVTDYSEVFAHDLARFFRLPEAEGGLECRDALCLDGGPSTQMYAEYKTLNVQIFGAWGIPNGIGVFPPGP